MKESEGVSEGTRCINAKACHAILTDQHFFCLKLAFNNKKKNKSIIQK